MKEKVIKEILCNFLVRTLQCFQFSFCPQKVEKTILKTQIHFFSLTASSAQTVQTEEYMYQNVAYRPTVYRTGGCTFVKLQENLKCIS